MNSLTICNGQDQNIAPRRPQGRTTALSARRPQVASNTRSSRQEVMTELLTLWATCRLDGGMEICQGRRNLHLAGESGEQG